MGLRKNLNVKDTKTYPSLLVFLVALIICENGVEAEKHREVNAGERSCVRGETRTVTQHLWVWLNVE
jgi:hypothetical protein